MKTIAVINQKGGVGKTSTALALGEGLSMRKRKVLLVDLDAQGNLTYTAGVGAAGYSAMDILQNPSLAGEAVQHAGHGDIIVSSPNLAGADTIIIQTGKEYRLREALETISGRYEYCVIDTPPALGILTINALTACDGAIIPAQADIYSVQGIAQLYNTIETVKRYCNPKLAIMGIVITRYNGRTIIRREVAEMLEENEVCSSEDFLDAVNSGEFGAYDMIGELTNLDERYFDLEGYLFPDTYDFYKDEELDSVVGKLLYNFQVKMSDSMMTLVEQSGMELDDVVKIASIIQAEAANEGDMFDVSTVIHNRLNLGADYGINSLECDSTVYYPYREAADIPETGALSYGAYNTYEITGLPPAPICNPGMQAIMAALTPNEGDYLYFCHSADGTPYYATTEEEHLQNLELAGLR